MDIIPKGSPMKPLEKTTEEWFELGQKYHENEEYEKAIDAYRHVVKINKFTNAWYNLGLAHRFNGNFDEAFKAFNKMRLLDPKDANVYFQLGLVLNGLEKYTHAIKKFNIAFELGLEPINQIDASVGRGISYLNLDKPNEAIENFDAALNLNCENLPALTMKAGALLILDNILGAKKVINDALRIDPENGEVLRIHRLIESALSSDRGDVSKKAGKK